MLSTKIRNRSLNMHMSLGSPDQPVYSATKFAIRGMTQGAARDYGKYGITVNAYAPGAVDTPLSEYWRTLSRDVLMVCDVMLCW